MPSFRYKAATADGKVLEGEMEAADRAAVIRLLQAEGHVPIRADASVGGGERSARGARAPLLSTRLGMARKAGQRDVELMTLELATLLRAGLSLDKALDLLGQLAAGSPIEPVLGRVRESVRGGKDLSAALAEEGTLFSPFFRNMVRAGEASGALGLALGRLNEFQERARELRETITSALVYPALLLVFAVISLTVILGVVVPRIATMFDDAGQQLPTMTRVVIGTGAFVNQWWWLMLAIAVGLWFIARARLRDPAVRARWDARLLRMPLIGSLVARFEAARFTRTLGTLLANGVNLLEGLGIAQAGINNRVLAAGVAEIASGVRAGRGLAAPLLEAEVFPTLANNLIKVGEESGHLEEMLLQLAEIYDRETRATVNRLVSLLGPVTILVLGGLIAGVIMSVLSAVLSVNELAF